MNPWSTHTFIIAEAGVNHNGNIDLAMQLVDAAAAAGCDAVKFQTFKSSALAAPSAPMASYQSVNTGQEEKQADMLARLELPYSAHYLLRDRARERGIAFFSTAFDTQSLEFLAELDIPVWKIPSGEITNLPYLRRIAKLGKPVILSTGMATLGEVHDAMEVLLDGGVDRSQLSILHCTTDYPTRYEHVNLRAMISLGHAFGTAVGYSDHTLGTEIPVAAVALGARVIEKHFTLDRALPGPDHAASLLPNELGAMVTQIRNIEAALGDGLKRPTPPEFANRKVARKSIVAARAIRQGEILRPEDLAAKRPGTGISPMAWDNVVGRVASRDFEIDEAIEW